MFGKLTQFIKKSTRPKVKESTKTKQEYDDNIRRTYGEWRDECNDWIRNDSPVDRYKRFDCWCEIKSLVFRPIQKKLGPTLEIKSFTPHNYFYLDDKGQVNIDLEDTVTTEKFIDILRLIKDTKYNPVIDKSKYDINISFRDVVIEGNMIASLGCKNGLDKLEKNINENNGDIPGDIPSHIFKDFQMGEVEITITEKYKVGCPFTFNLSLFIYNPNNRGEIDKKIGRLSLKRRAQYYAENGGELTYRFVGCLIETSEIKGNMIDIKVTSSNKSYPDVVIHKDSTLMKDVHLDDDDVYNLDGLHNLLSLYSITVDPNRMTSHLTISNKKEVTTLYMKTTGMALRKDIWNIYEAIKDSKSPFYKR